MSYHHRRRQEWGRNPKTERIVTVVMLVVLVATLAVFLLVYHDLPFRPS